VEVREAVAINKTVGSFHLFKEIQKLISKIYNIGIPGTQWAAPPPNPNSHWQMSLWQQPYLLHFLPPVLILVSEKWAKIILKAPRFKFASYVS